MTLEDSPQPCPVPLTGLIRIRLRFNVGHLVAWVDPDQLDQLIGAATESDYVVPTLLIVERLTDGTPA